MTDVISSYKLSVRPVPLVISVITGFLGAGKTTFLNRILTDNQLNDTVVIINEAGEVGLDHALVETLNDDTTLLSAGCMCCMVSGDLVGTLEDLLRRRDNKRMPAFSRVIIETTGLADPASVLNAVLTHPYLRLRYVMNGLITLVDGMNGLNALLENQETVRQVAMADHILLSKVNLIESKRPDPALISRIQQLNPHARITDISSLYEAGDDDIVQKCISMITRLNPFHVDGKISGVREWLGVGNEVGAEAEAQDHQSTIKRNDGDRISSFVLRHNKPIAQRSLDLFFDLLRATHGKKLLRVKGVIALDDDPHSPLLVHMVQHLLHPFKRLPAWPDDLHETCIVFVLDDLEPAYITQLWNAFIH